MSEQNLTAINNKPLPGNDIAPNLIIGEKYAEVSRIICDCGQEHIDVGLQSVHNYIRCYNCKKELPKGDMIHWCHPSRFKIEVNDQNQ